MTSEISTYLIDTDEGVVKQIADKINDAGGMIFYDPHPFNTLYDATYVEDLEDLKEAIDEEFPDVRATYGWDPMDDSELLEIVGAEGYVKPTDLTHEEREEK